MGCGRVSVCIVLAVSLVIGGCTATSLTPEAQKKIHRIGIVSAVGDELTMQNVPTFIWDQETYVRPIADWNIDSFVTGEVAGLLGATYEIVPLDYDRAAFTGQVLFPGKRGPLAPGRQLADILRTSVRPATVDAYIVVLKDDEAVSSTKTRAPGLGVLRRPLLGDDRYLVHAVYWVAVVAGSTFEPLAAVDAPDKHENSFDGTLWGKPNREVGADRWMEGEGPLPAAQQALLRQDLESLLAETLPGALRKLKFTVATP